MTSRIVPAAGLALVGLALPACGDDEAADATPPSDAALTVEAHDIDFDRDSYRLTAGSQEIGYVQEGETRHTLLVETADGDDVGGFELEVGGEEADSATLDLEPGRYTFYCDVPGHRDAGMEADLVVE